VAAQPDQQGLTPRERPGGSQVPPGRSRFRRGQRRLARCQVRRDGVGPQA
jgi:hypothetical protein